MSKVLYLEAPNNKMLDSNSVFLAGGITNCTDWQKIVLEEIRNQFPTRNFNYDITVMNPRREKFDISNPEESQIQILWEYQHINHYSNVFSVWFSGGLSVQPITLFELGAALHRFQPSQICIGIEPGYCREFDVVTQVDLVNPGSSALIARNYKDHSSNILSALKLFDYKNM